MCCIWENNISRYITAQLYDSEDQPAILHSQDKCMFVSCCRAGILPAFERSGYYMLIQFYISGDIYFELIDVMYMRGIFRCRAEDYNFERFSLVVRPSVQFQDCVYVNKYRDKYGRKFKSENYCIFTLINSLLDVQQDTPLIFIPRKQIWDQPKFKKCVLQLTLDEAMNISGRV
jgi:hypothetical protein